MKGRLLSLMSQSMQMRGRWKTRWRNVVEAGDWNSNEVWARPWEQVPLLLLQLQEAPKEEWESVSRLLLCSEDLPSCEALKDGHHVPEIIHHFPKPDSLYESALVAKTTAQASSRRSAQTVLLDYPRASPTGGST